MQPSSTPGPRGARRILFAVLAILLSLLAAAAIGEAALRLAGYSPANVNPLKAFHEFDPVIGWRGRKLFTARFKRPDFDVVVAQNAAGFRKQVNLEPKLNKAPHSVFVFGDSFVWGWGVGQGEVFTDRMNLLLPDYSVRNYGINGVGTVVEYELFSNEVRQSVRPGDVVILMFCNNDYADNVDRDKFHAEAANGEVKIVNPAKALSSPLEDWIKNHSYLVQLPLVSRRPLPCHARQPQATGRTPWPHDLRVGRALRRRQVFPGEVPSGLPGRESAIHRGPHSLAGRAFRVPDRAAQPGGQRKGAHRDSLYDHPRVAHRDGGPAARLPRPQKQDRRDPHLQE